jgi:hypothetical protein
MREPLIPQYHPARPSPGSSGRALPSQATSGFQIRRGPQGGYALDPLQVTRLVILFTTLFCTVAQIVIGIDEFLCLPLDLVGIGMMFYSLGRRVLSETSISAMMLLGYGLSWFFLPLVATTIEGKSLVNNLDVPLQVFLHNLILYATLILAHLLYHRVGYFQQIRVLISRKVLLPLGLFTPPPATLLWTLGFLGLASGFLATNYSENGGLYQEGGVFKKFIAGYIPFTYAPYFLFVMPMMGKREAYTSKRRIPQIIFYSLLILGLGLVRNSRAAVLLGFAGLGLTLFLGIILRDIRTPNFRSGKLLLLIALAIVAFSQMTKFAKAMVIARAERDKISVSELVRTTLSIAMNPKELQAYEEEQEKAANSDWDEKYVDNLFLSRLCNLKYADNTLRMVGAFSNAQRSLLRENELQKVLCTIPSPLLKLLHISVDKEFVNSGCGGDVIYNISGARNAMGGFRTGSLIAIIYGIFGWHYPIWIGFTALGLYLVADTLVLWKIGSSGQYSQCFSLVILISMYVITFFLTSAGGGCDAYSTVVAFLIRGFIQMSLLYALVLWGILIFIRNKSI